MLYELTSCCNWETCSCKICLSCSATFSCVCVSTEENTHDEYGLEPVHAGDFISMLVFLKREERTGLEPECVGQYLICNFVSSLSLYPQCLGAL